MVTPRAQRDEPGVGRKRFEYPHGAVPTEDAHLPRGEAGVSLLAETPGVPAPYSLKLSCGLKSPLAGAARFPLRPGQRSASRSTPQRLAAFGPPRSRSVARPTPPARHAAVRPMANQLLVRTGEMARRQEEGPNSEIFGAIARYLPTLSGMRLL